MSSAALISLLALNKIVASVAIIIAALSNALIIIILLGPENYPAR
jgi:hypothetical protein